MPSDDHLDALDEQEARAVTSLAGWATMAMHSADDPAEAYRYQGLCRGVLMATKAIEHGSPFDDDVTKAYAKIYDAMGKADEAITSPNAGKGSPEVGVQ